MDKILVIFTGGTIGSSGDEIISPDRGAGFRLLEMYRSEFGENIEFDAVQPLSELSENIGPEELAVICRSIAAADHSKYKGIIVTYGSDTLSYASSFLGLLFGSKGIPIVLIAADRPLGQPGGNGLINFAGAVEFIMGAGMSGVFTVYRSGEVTEVFLATRILEADSYHGRFLPFGDSPLGLVGDNGFERLLLPGESEHPAKFQTPKEIGFSKKVMMIKPYPGLDYLAIDLSDPPCAVLQLGYHSGTASTKGAGSFSNFATRLKQRGIPAYICPSRPEGSPIYSSSAEIIGGGVVPLGMISPESAYAKLMIAYNLFPERAEEYISTDIYFEYI